MAVDGSNNIYFSGFRSGWTGFLSKVNSTGTEQWTKTFSTTSNDNGNTDVAVDSSGNVYITGHTSNDIDGNTNLGGTDIFIQKYNTSGDKQWTRTIGTSSDENPGGITIDSSGNFFVTGSTSGGLDGNTSAGSKDLFVVKYNSSGTQQ